MRLEPWGDVGEEQRKKKPLNIQKMRTDPGQDLDNETM